MDSYLNIAYKVLKASERPLSPRDILSIAYKADLVPENLSGKTQHKTMQARLSEDILHKRELSAFYRTEPGKFFVTEALDDPTVSNDHKVVFRARRRIRDLKRNNPITVNKSFWENFNSNGNVGGDNFAKFFDNAQKAHALKLSDENSKDSDRLNIWTFSIVQKKELVLSYRLGKYRNGGESLDLNQTIGFKNQVAVEDKTLFSIDPLGALDNSISTLKWDLDLSPIVFEGQNSSRPKPLRMFATNEPNGKMALVIVFLWSCPSWFEPFRRRLSLNDPHWIDFEHMPNHIEAFEPWSQKIFELQNSSTKR